MSFKEFLSFWYTDKIVIIYLSCSVFTWYGVPYVYKQYIYEPEVVDFSDFSEEVRLAYERLEIAEEKYLASRDSVKAAKYDSYQSSRPKYYSSNKKSKKKRSLKPRRFNPNTLTLADAQEMGFSDFVSKNIDSYLSKGYEFRTKERFLETYGLEESDKLALYDFIDLPTEKAFEKQKEENYRLLQEKWAREKEEKKLAAKTKYAKEKKSYPSKPAVIVDINTATETELQTIRGIGEVYAVEIVDFRNKLGAFTSVEQLRDVPMMRDSIFQELKGQVTLTEKSIKRINVNKADIGVLKAHPYISYRIAKSIDALRKQHGSFTNIEQLKRSKLIGEEDFDKMKDYLVVE